jgi:hypothetical protein
MATVADPTDQTSGVWRGGGRARDSLADDPLARTRGVLSFETQGEGLGGVGGVTQVFRTAHPPGFLATVPMTKPRDQRVFLSSRPQGGIWGMGGAKHVHRTARHPDPSLRF